MSSVVLLAMFATAGLLVMRRADRRRPTTSFVAFRLVFPRDLGADAVVAFLRSLEGLLPPWWKRFRGVPAVVFEVAATERGIEHRMLVPRGSAPYVVGQLRAVCPGARITPDPAVIPTLSLAGEFRLSTHKAALRTSEPEAVAAAIIGVFPTLNRSEFAVLQWVVAPTAPRSIRALLTTTILELVLTAIGNTSPTPADSKALKEKFGEPSLGVAARIGVLASPARSRQVLRSLSGVFHVVRTPAVHMRRRLLPSMWSASLIEQRRVFLGRLPMLLNVKELATVIGFPIGSPLLPGLSLGGCRQLPPPPEVPSAGRVLAQATFPGAERPIAISVADSLRHMHVVGPTGVGKSTLLLNLIVGDMRLGAGVVVIDPKGDLVADVLARVPANRERDVILLDPSDDERPVGFNLLSGAERDRELVVDQVVGIIHRLYAAFWGPRSDDILRAGLLTLLHAPGMTLVEVPALLADENFRRRLLARVDDPIGLEPFWNWYEGMSAAERTNAIGPVMNKLRAFLLRRRIRNVIGQATPALDLEQVVGENKILLVNLAKGVLGEEASALLGSLLVARLWQAVQGRASLAPTDRAPMFLYLDEFQDFLNLPTSVADLLAQARGLGLSLTLAHQHMGQLPPAMRQAVLANARTKVVFQTASADAATLAKEFAPHLEANDLRALAAFEVAAAISVGSEVSRPVTGRTLPPPEETGRGEFARELSRARYGEAEAEVEAAIRRRQQFADNASPLRRRSLS